MSTAVVDRPVAEYPSYDKTEDLLRDLRKQDFEVGEVHDGWHIVSPYSKTTTTLHRGAVPLVALQRLREMGFFPPSLVKKLKLCKECGQRFMGVQKLTQHRIDEHGYRLTCKICGKTGLMSVTDVSTHVNQAHPETTKRGRKRLGLETPEPTVVEVTSEGPVPVTEEKKPRRKRAPVRRGYTGDIGEFMKALDEAKNALDIVGEQYKGLYKKYQLDHKKLNDIESALGKAIGKL